MPYHTTNLKWIPPEHCKETKGEKKRKRNSCTLVQSRTRRMQFGKSKSTKRWKTRKEQVVIVKVEETKKKNQQEPRPSNIKPAIKLNSLKFVSHFVDVAVCARPKKRPKTRFSFRFFHSIRLAPVCVCSAILFNFYLILVTKSLEAPSNAR